MIGEYMAAVYVIAGGAAVVAGVSVLPPLTTDSSGVSVAGQRQTYQAADYQTCRTEMQGLNCICYAQISSEIKASEKPKMRGYIYVDPSTLARVQTGRSC